MTGRAVLAAEASWLEPLAQPEGAATGVGVKDGKVKPRSVALSGERFDIEWDDSPVIELYAFELNGRTLCISLQYDADDAKKAEDLFGPILGTLE